MDDQRCGGVFRYELKCGSHADPQLLFSRQQPEKDLVLGKVRYGRVSPAVAFSLPGIQPQFLADAPVGPLRRGFSELDCQPVMVERFGDIPGGGQPVDKFGGFVPKRDDLEGGDIHPV